MFVFNENDELYILLKKLEAEEIAKQNAANNPSQFWLFLQVVELFLLVSLLVHFLKNHRVSNLIHHANSPSLPETNNHGRLISAGFSDDEVINHPTLGHLVDPITREIAERPVILNTGDIVSRDIAEELIATRQRMPNGHARFFVQSHSLHHLTNNLVTEEAHRRHNARRKPD